ncbi:M66 family metalloprotease [Photobacterium aquimaris]|uniref:Metalloprotease StcE n=1 Tax=Photobacterium aquimaris TaxID=512643 RepID=A0A1Y6KY30_9GAMM|nr:M66 family metalloprotease [Photobacterium aquimaris]SMY16276.1 Metalloprotease StcE precursor [Photobacterium aquimaris]
MKIKLLAVLIGGSLFSTGALATDNSLTDIATNTFDALNNMQALAQQPSNVIERDGRQYLQYKGKEYRLNHEQSPMFPLNDTNGEYSTAFPFVGPEWEYVAYNGGFYLLHRQFGIMNSDDTGCFVEYIPAARGSQHDDGSYIWESELVQRTVTSDCGDLSMPTISEFKTGSVSDIGVELVWNDTVVGNSYKIELTEYREGESSITYNYPAKKSGFYIADLEPNTQYDVKLVECNQLGCDEKSLSFNTLSSRLSYNDSRQAVNHLVGNLKANVALAQTHTSVAPYGNDEVKHPNLVMNRESLLLVTPKLRNVNQLWVDVELDGVSMGRFLMHPPSALPDTDQLDNGKSKVIFSHYAWSLPLNWEWMKPGLSLKFSDNRDREGEITQDLLAFGGAPELVIQNIDIGMLVEPRNQYDMINNMEQLATDYFQKIPVSKMVVADYTPLHLRKVTLPNGKVYTKASEYATPGVYEGDMREYIGKRLISIGINNANFGVVDTAGGDASWPRPFSHITAHNNRGRYLVKDKESGVITSTVVNHGLSGGGGIVTLSGTRGNEWSHELGHNFGRGHHPKNASLHDMESGWGWDARYKRFIGNIHWSDAAVTMTNNNSGESVPPFANEFRFMREAMADGEVALTGLISNYTLEHPMATRVTQDWFNRSNNLDTNSSTGFVKWDQTSQRYVESDTGFAAATQQGVPVITVLGIYDPTETNSSQIYPLTYSNYGNLFDLPAPSTIAPQREGWVAITDLNDTDRELTQWQQIKIDNQWLPLCQFSYTNTNGEIANFVGYEDTITAMCRVSSDMFWSVNNQREVPVSSVNDYQLLASKGDKLGNVTYTPTVELGEKTLCSLDKLGTSHDGAGFIENDKCVQIANVKHINGANWAYATHQGGIKQYSLTSQKQCQLIVEGENGDITNIALSGFRHNSSESNKLHLNLPANNHPARITIECSTMPGTESVLDTVTTPRNPAVADLREPVIIGQEHGYKVLESSIPAGWFAHTEGFDPKTLSNRDRSSLATLSMGSERPNVCRFPLTINGVEQTVHGYVEDFGNGDFQCTGGTEITVTDSQGEMPLVSAVNQFEWISLNNPQQVGQRVKAVADNDANLCSVTRSGFYGAGFINAGSQCTQVQGIKWSNGNHWTFSSGHGQYSYQ